MRTTLLCLVVVALVAAAAAVDRDVAKDALTNYRVRSQNLHIDHIEEQLDELEEMFDALNEEVDPEEVDRIKARVHNLEVDQCPHENEVSCGGDWPECVHHLLFCDGVNDCHNGHDEDEDLCDGDIIKVGSSFRGIVHWHRCVAADDHYSTITITAAKRAPFFTNRMFVRATITREYEENHEALSYQAVGAYSFAQRKLTLTANKDSPQKVSIACLFNLGSDDTATCEITSTASQTECGRSRVTRV